MRPRGFVCAGEAATTDLKHPTLAAMSLQPKLDRPLPYTYAKVRKATSLYEKDPKKKNAVKHVGKLRRRTVLAIVGSWSAVDGKGKMQRLGLTTSGRFVRAADLEPAPGTDFKGVELGERQLPLAFVVKRGVRAWHVEKGEAEKLRKLKYHEIFDLTGRFRTVGPLKYWATADDLYLRHRDVTSIRPRNVWPDFATGDQKWIDVSIITGTMIAYEGRKPIYVTLVSVGRDRLGGEEATAATQQGTFEVVGKHITAAKLNPKSIEDYFEVYDAPWAIELSSGQLLHGANWHNRFGIERGLGNVQLAPADAQFLWGWVEPNVPAGWHGVTDKPKKKTFVVVRK